MVMENKFREFTLTTDEGKIHVIEYSAYEQLKAESEVLKFKNENQAKTIDELNPEKTLALRGRINQLEKQIEQLKAELKATNGLREMDIKQCMRMNDEIATLKKENEELSQSELECRQMYNEFVGDLNETRIENTKLKSKLEIAKKGLEEALIKVAYVDE